MVTTSPKVKGHCLKKWKHYWKHNKLLELIMWKIALQMTQGISVYLLWRDTSDNHMFTTHPLNCQLGNSTWTSAGFNILEVSRRLICPTQSSIWHEITWILYAGREQKIHVKYNAQYEMKSDGFNYKMLGVNRKHIYMFNEMFHMTGIQRHLTCWKAAENICSTQYSIWQEISWI